MESGQAPLEVEELALEPLMARRIEAAAWRAAEAGLELVWQPGPAPTVRADVGRLERVVDHLLDNALRHTPAGGTVTVRLRGSAPPAALLSVHNTGPAIPAEDLPRVFERF